MNIRPVEEELFHADGRRDWKTDRHDKANSRFSQIFERTRIYSVGWIELSPNRVRIISAILP